MIERLGATRSLVQPRANVTGVSCRSPHDLRIMDTKRVMRTGNRMVPQEERLYEISRNISDVDLCGVLVRICLVMGVAREA